MIEVKSNGKVSARDLHKMLGNNRKFTDWIKQRIEQYYFSKGKDFTTYHKIVKRSKTNEYDLTVDMAKELCLVENNNKGRELRKYFISIQEQKQKGESFTGEQIHALIDLSHSLTLVSNQERAKNGHFETHKNKYTFYKNRYKILGYSKADIETAMHKVNKKHISLTKSLLKLDSSEIIRVGVIDFFKAIGQTNEYAVNAGNICKRFAKEMNLGTKIWNDKKTNPLGINQDSVNERKGLFGNIKSIFN